VDDGARWSLAVQLSMRRMVYDSRSSIGAVAFEER
jgi:hypothetical protein